MAGSPSGTAEIIITTAIVTIQELPPQPPWFGQFQAPPLLVVVAELVVDGTEVVEVDVFDPGAFVTVVVVEVGAPGVELVDVELVEPGFAC